jgi:hypothetical protein
MPVDFPYWEGVVQVAADDAGMRLGYLELTGYVPEAGFIYIAGMVLPTALAPSSLLEICD